MSLSSARTWGLERMRGTCLWRIRGLSLHSGLDTGKLSKMPAFSRLWIPHLQMVLSAALALKSCAVSFLMAEEIRIRSDEKGMRLTCTLSVWRTPG